MDFLIFACGMIDYKYRKIPNIMIILVAAWSLFFSSALPFERVAGFLVTAIPLFILAITTGKIKGGDYKFLVVCAAALGISVFIKTLFFAVIIAIGWSFLRHEDSVPLAFVFMGGYLIFSIL